MRELLFVILAAMVSAKVRYPGGKKPSAYGNNYPARVPRVQQFHELGRRVAVQQSKPTVNTPIINIVPTTSVAVSQEEPYDYTITEWVTQIDPRRVVTTTMTSTVTMAKFNNYEQTSDDKYHYSDDDIDGDQSEQPYYSDDYWFRR